MKELFARYLNNACTREELTVLLRYFGSGKDECAIRELVHRELEAHFDAEEVPQTAQTTTLKKSFLNIADKTYLKDRGRIIRFDRRSIVIKFVACASIILLIGVVYFGKQYIHTPAVHEYVHVTTQKSERRQFKLADGTKIWLAPSSVLNYPKNFKGKTREISLSGEAFFEVAHDTQHPFIIHTGKLKTTVLGTVFNIRAYIDQAAVEVALLSGKVSVSKQGKPTLILMPDQRAILSKINDSLYKEDYLGGQDLFARRQGRFIYKGTVLSEVLNDISKLYGVTILADKEIQNLRYYGEFDQKENLEQVLMQIGLSTGLRLKNNSSIWRLQK